MPVRLQRQRTKGWRAPEGAIYVGRPSKWGNPWKVGQTYWRQDGLPWHIWDRQSAVLAFRFWLIDILDPTRADCASVREALAELRGHDLLCWCPLDQPCHADVLLEIANG